MKESEVFTAVGGKKREDMPDTECPILKIKEQKISDKARGISVDLPSGSIDIITYYDDGMNEKFNGQLACVALALASFFKNKKR